MRRFATTRVAWWVPYALGAVAAAGVLALMVWQVVSRGPLVAADWPVHEVFAERVPDGAGKIALDTIAKPGQRWLTLPLLLGLGALVGWRHRRVRPLLAVLAGLGTAYVVGKTVKDALGRTPPYKDVDILHGVGEAFPSGHAANAAMTWALASILLFGAGGLAPNRRRLRIGLAAGAGLAVLVGVVMVVMDYHWLTDVPGGWLVGLLALMVALLVLGPPPTSGEDERNRDRSEALAATGEPEPIGGGSTEGDRGTDRLREDRLGFGPP
jgi:membrane-associated phospholipid phosphatase